MNKQNSHFAPLTPKLALQLAAPHTWPASVLPVLVAICCAAVTCSVLSFIMGIVVLVIAVLMQSSVNTFNDYYDYIKGVDTSDDYVEKTDATLIYNNINPRSALYLAIFFLVAAFLLGIYVIARVGLIPLIIAIVGAFFVIGYSAGKTPISYLPIGELVSGVVMGCLITVASYFSLSGVFDLRCFLWSIPTICGVALIMFTNNTCDIEKDVLSKRNTLAVRLGRDKARALYHLIVYIWIMAVIVLVVVFFTSGAIVLPVMLFALYPLLKALIINPLNPVSRIAAMSQICSVNVCLNGLYAASICVGGSCALIL